MDMEHHDDGTTTVKANVGKDFTHFSEQQRVQMLMAAELFIRQLQTHATPVFEAILDEEDTPDDEYAEIATEFAGIVLKMVARTVSELVGPLVDDMKAEIPSGGGIITVGWKVNDDGE